jgi:threonine/homoserine/homoserine lactone efflux protein
VADSSIALIGAFAVVAALLVITPGVGTAFLISTVVSHGRRAGYLTALGMVAGAAIHALVAAFGTSALLRIFPGALTWIALLGGAFIVWIGARGIYFALRPRARAGDAVVTHRARHQQLTTGILIALGNAPLPLFYLVIVPQYVPRSMTPLTGALLLSSIHLAMAGTWMATLVTLLGRLVEVLRRPRVMLTMQVVTGIALLYLGIAAIGGARS